MNKVLTIPSNKREYQWRYLLGLELLHEQAKVGRMLMQSKYEDYKKEPDDVA